MKTNNLEPFFNKAIHGQYCETCLFENYLQTIFCQTVHKNHFFSKSKNLETNLQTRHVVCL